LISIQSELIIGRLWYLIKGAAPHTNCPTIAVFNLTIKLDHKDKIDSIPLTTPQLFAQLLLSLLSMLYILVLQTTTVYSKAPQGLLFPHDFTGFFTCIKISSISSQGQFAFR